MILRQIIIRHGRPVLTASSKRIQRCYATNINIDNQSLRQSERDHQPIKSIPGHPDEPSSLLDAIDYNPRTADTAPISDSVGLSQEDLDSLAGEVNALSAAQNGGAIPVSKTSFSFQSPSDLPPAPFKSLQEFKDSRIARREATSQGSTTSDLYYPWTIIEDPPRSDEITLPMLLANQCHLGHATALWHPGNSSYIFGIRHGIHIISLEITLSYLRRAAKVVQEVARRGGIILFVGTRKQTREIVVSSAKRAQGYHIFSRWIPGSLTNGQQILDNCAVKVVNAKDDELEAYKEALSNSSHAVLRPDLVVCLNPLENEVCLHECGLYNVPTIGIVDTDVNPAWVTYPIPANDDSPRSVALIAGVLARAGEAGQAMRRAEAEQGRTTYDTKRTQKFLQGMEEISDLGDVQDSRGEKKDKDVD